MHFAECLAPLLAAAVATVSAQTGPTRPEIVRTEHGVPHIYARDFWGAGYGLAWVELEDHGARVVRALVGARGTMGLAFGRDSVEQDFIRRPIRAAAERAWLRLEPATRQMYQGFATAVNEYLAIRPTEFPIAFGPPFTGQDVLSRDMTPVDVAGARRLVDRRAPLRPAPSRGDGSNAWALGPTRTLSGYPILLRNPHLDWDAGYYEAHLVITDVLDFYGDFRIGSMLGVVGGFNPHLGWTTTNNAPDLDEVYQVPLVAGHPDQIRLDGRPMRLSQTVTTVAVRTDSGEMKLTRREWRSPFGPVVDRRNGVAYILKTAGEGEFRLGEQFLKMMRARTLAEWTAAMKMRAKVTSNFTYADQAGNILYVWNATIPALPHPPGGDSVIITARSRRDMFSRVVPWDSLPLIANPTTGYLHNENDSPHYANLEQPIDPARLPRNVERPALGLRSQHALDLIRHPDDKLSLEDIIREKHSYRMLLADRVLPDLLRAIDGQAPNALPGAAVRLLEDWDRTAAPTSRGGVLFEMWWRLYQAKIEQPFAEAWTAAKPTTTPRGLADPVLAVSAFKRAVDSVVTRYGRIDVAWGDVHRIRLGNHDLPVGGCPGDLGCFRVLWFTDQPDGKRVVKGGDGWILAVEFGPVPRAYSVLAYGESSRPTSPYFADQAARFAQGNLKPVAWTRAEVERAAIARYRAGCAANDPLCRQ